MSLASSLESLRKIDVNDLDLNNIGRLAGGGQGHRLHAADRGGPGAGLQLPSP